MEGIVLKSLSYKEKSKLVYLYTPVGMKSVLVYDINKNTGFTMTLNCVSYEVKKGNLPSLLSYELLESHYGMNVHLIGYVMVMVQVVESLPEDALHKRVYPFFKLCLNGLLQAKKPAFYLTLFLVKMLAVFGVRPAFQACVRCGKSSIVGFSVVDGGALCDECMNSSEKDLILFQELKALYEDRQFKEELFSSFHYDLLIDSLYQYYMIHASLRLKSYKNGLDK